MKDSTRTVYLNCGESCEDPQMAITVLNTTQAAVKLKPEKNPGLN